MKTFLKHLLTHGITLLAAAVCFAACVLAAALCYSAHILSDAGLKAAEMGRWEQVAGSPLSFDRKTGEFFVKPVED